MVILSRIATCLREGPPIAGRHLCYWPFPVVYMKGESCRVMMVRDNERAGVKRHVCMLVSAWDTRGMWWRCLRFGWIAPRDRHPIKSVDIPQRQKLML